MRGLTGRLTSGRESVVWMYFHAQDAPEALSTPWKLETITRCVRGITTAYLAPYQVPRSVI